MGHGGAHPPLNRVGYRGFSRERQFLTAEDCSEDKASTNNLSGVSSSQYDSICVYCEYVNDRWPETLSNLLTLVVVITVELL